MTLDGIISVAVPTLIYMSVELFFELTKDTRKVPPLEYTLYLILGMTLAFIAFSALCLLRQGVGKAFINKKFIFAGVFAG